MAPKRKQIPFNDVKIEIKGLRTLWEEEKLSKTKIAEYYTKVFGTNISRETVRRNIKRMEEGEEEEEFRLNN